jgi:RNA polymerase sigma factor (sigma-70 family)
VSTTDVTPDLADPELISRVRDGDVAAYGTLFSRHVDAATRLARMLVNGPDADDLVSEAFVKVLNVLLGGGGPDVAFRAYLLTAVRRLHVDKVRSTQKATPIGDLTPFDPGVPFTDTAVAGFEGGAAAKAFASLPERWQLVLWHLEVENQKPADIAPLLGVSANSVSALAYRAREGLRQAFLNMHSGDLVDERCEQTHGLLGGYVRGGLAKRDAAKVEDHLDHCRPCTAVYLELCEVNSSLAALLGPAVLGGVAVAYLGGGAAISSGSLTLLTLLDRGKDFVLANAPASAATAGVVGVAAATAVAVGVQAPEPRTPTADPPVPSSTRRAPDPVLTSPPTVTQDLTQAGRRAARAKRTRDDAAVPAPVVPTSSVTPSATPTEPAGASPSADPSAEDQAPADDNPTAPDPTEGQSTDPDPPVVDPPDPPVDPPTDPATDPATDPTDPPPVESDLSVAVTTLGRHTLQATVSGVPEDARATLVVTSTKGSLHTVTLVGCKRSEHRSSCPVTGPRQVFVFNVASGPGTTVTFSVSPGDGWRDSTPDNNDATVQVPGMAGGGPGDDDGGDHDSMG